MALEGLSLGHASLFVNHCISLSVSSISKLEHGRVSRSGCTFCLLSADSTRRSNFIITNRLRTLKGRSHLKCYLRKDTHFLPSDFRNMHKRSSGIVNKDVLPVVEARDRSADKPPVFLLNEKPARMLPAEKEISKEISNGPTSAEVDAAPVTIDPDHRSGYVALIGKPNVGKSTLLNQLVGQKLSIVTSKPQTTRHRILGICSAPGYQMVFFDTPGVIPKRMHKLDDMMMQNVRSAAINADCVLVVVDATESPEKVMDMLEEGAENIVDNRPALLVLNKKDLVKPGEVAKKKEWYERFGGVNEVVAVSAKFGQGVEDLKSWLVSKLPLGPAYYPKDHVSDQPEKFFAAEIVREKIFMQYLKEIPYACQVNIITYIERDPPAKDYIEIEIVVEKDSQKAIVIGKDGLALKTLSTAARLDIEDFVGKEVYMEVKVKVKENWRKNEDLLKYYGYSGQLLR